jgi:hypothetical protein
VSGFSLLRPDRRCTKGSGEEASWEEAKASLPVPSDGTAGEEEEEDEEEEIVEEEREEEGCGLPAATSAPEFKLREGGEEREGAGFGFSEPPFSCS